MLLMIEKPRPPPAERGPAPRSRARLGGVPGRGGQAPAARAGHRDGAERQALAHAVAERALRDAHRAGIDAEELVDAIRAVADGTADGAVLHPHTSETPA